MKLMFKTKYLCKVILGFLAIATLLSISNIANAEQASDKSVISKSSIERMGAFFNLNGNKVPTYWANPVVPTSFDATGKYKKLINKAKVFALFNAMSSGAKTINDKGVNSNPTLAFVIADHIFEGSALTSELKKNLLKKWRNTPLAEALNSSVTQTNYGDIVEGKDCSLFVSGTQINSDLSHYITISAIIIANSTMSKEDILLCFKNKSALVFGMNARPLVVDREANKQLINFIYFGYYPALLEVASACRVEELDNSLACYTRRITKKLNRILESVTSTK